MDLILAIVISTVLAVIAAAIGSQVQKLCKFIFPTDFISIGIMVFIGFDLFLLVLEVNMIPIDPFWYIPFFAGYWLGYVIVGCTNYIEVIDLRLRAKHFDIQPWVLYEVEGKLFIQEQTNIALFRRIFFGIKHAVISNVYLDDDWTIGAKFPMFPIFNKRACIIQFQETSYKLVPVSGKLCMKEYTTIIRLAYGSMVSKAQLATDEKYLEQMQKEMVRSVNEIHALKSEQGSKMMEMALAVHNKVDSTSPENRVFDLAKRFLKNSPLNDVPDRPIENKEVDPYGE